MSEWSRVRRLDLPLAHAVAARVADVADVHAALAGAEHRAHHRRPHAVVLARARAALEDLPVGHADAREQAVFLFRQVGVEVERPGHVLVRGGTEELRDGLRRDARGHVASAVTAHAVRDDIEVILLEHHEGVFVVLALEPYVAQPGRDCPHQMAPFLQRKKTFTRRIQCQGHPRRPLAATARQVIRLRQTSRMSFSLCAIIVSTSSCPRPRSLRPSSSRDPRRLSLLLRPSRSG